MNIIAILNHLGVFFKEEPIRQLQASLERKGFEVVYPVDVADLLKLIEKNPRVCGAIFDWAVGPDTVAELSVDAPVQRFWRDAHAGRVHAANDPERAYLIFGNHEFGLPPADTMV